MVAGDRRADDPRPLAEVGRCTREGLTGTEPGLQSVHPSAGRPSDADGHPRARAEDWRSDPADDVGNPAASVTPALPTERLRPVG
ncbi:hypothetical protein MICRO80W_270048 [Micrococcus luteus]|nr:hypothetical protein MICRO80W_270048 [Micrococcus luteus]